MRYVAYGKQSGLCDHLHATMTSAERCCGVDGDDRVPCATSTAMHHAIRTGNRELQLELIRREESASSEPWRIIE